MPRRLIAALATALLSGAAAEAAPLSCVDERGNAVITAGAGNDGNGRLTLTEGEAGRNLHVTSWKVCLSCAALPRLRLDLADAADGKPTTIIQFGITACGDLDHPNPDRYCAQAAAVDAGEQPRRHCQLPEGTTLRQLWSALYGATPPRLRGGFWVHPQ